MAHVAGVVVGDGCTGSCCCFLYYCDDDGDGVFLLMNGACYYYVSRYLLPFLSLVGNRDGLSSVGEVFYFPHNQMP